MHLSCDRNGPATGSGVERLEIVLAELGGKPSSLEDL